MQPQQEILLFYHCILESIFLLFGAPVSSAVRSNHAERAVGLRYATKLLQTTDAALNLYGTQLLRAALQSRGGELRLEAIHEETEGKKERFEAITNEYEETKRFQDCR